MESPKSYTEAEMLRRLGTDENFKIIEQPQVDFPAEINHTGFESEYPKQTPHVADEVDSLVYACKSFLSGIVITDTFTDHTQRREWRHSMNAKYGDAFTKLYEKNKLRINNLGSIYSWFEVLARGVDIFKVHSEKAEAVKALARQLPNLSDYDSLSVEEKVELVSKVDEICKSFLNIVSK